MQNVSNNAYEKYLKSRPPASSESNKRIKEINISNAGILPEFRNSNSSTEDFLSKMKNYRPRGVNYLNFIFLINNRSVSSKIQFNEYKLFFIPDCI